MRLRGGFIQCRFIRCSAASDEKEVVLLSKTQSYKHPSPIEAQLRAVTGKQESCEGVCGIASHAEIFCQSLGKAKRLPESGLLSPSHLCFLLSFCPTLVSFYFYACVFMLVCDVCIHVPSCRYMCHMSQINMTCAGRKRILISLSTIFPGHSLSLKLERSVSALQSLRLHTRVGYTWV